MEKTGIEKLTKAIIEEANKEKALIFTNRIGVLLAENGVKVKTRENKFFDAMYGTCFMKKKGYSVDSLDFTEHDKPYKNEIKALREQIEELKAELKVRDNLLKIKKIEATIVPIVAAKNIIDNYCDSDIEQITGHLNVYLKRDEA